MIDKLHNIMVDIETFGDVSNSVIASVGAAKFNIETGEIYDTFYRIVDIQSCIDIGMVVTGHTIKWWLKQNKEAIDELCRKDTHDIRDVLDDFGEFCKGDEPYNVWGNSPRFDLGILRDGYKLTKKTIPWEFRKELDVRTLVALKPEIKENWKFNGSYHNALDDCREQIGYLVKTYNSIFPKKIELVVEKEYSHLITMKDYKLIGDENYDKLLEYVNNLDIYPKLHNIIKVNDTSWDYVELIITTEKAYQKLLNKEIKMIYPETIRLKMDKFNNFLELNK